MKHRHAALGRRYGVSAVRLRHRWCAPSLIKLANVERFHAANSDSAHRPGFLLHDSPREADLGLRLYHGFISFVAAMETDFATRGGCPFQYILTTATPPPRLVVDELISRCASMR